MQDEILISELFRTEYSKLIAVLCKVFGLPEMEIAEDIVGDTFLLASQTWGKKGIPDKPVAWLYTVAKNRTRDYLRRDQNLREKVIPQLQSNQQASSEIPVDLSDQNIQDSQLRMLFAICHPEISQKNQIILALRILCGFGVEAIAAALLSNKASINKNLYRAKKSLREDKISLEFPLEEALPPRLENVLTTLYLLFNEGYYSASSDGKGKIRKDLCLEAMRLVLLLLNHKTSQKPEVYALMALMCFQASRIEARSGKNGELILYEDQNRELWNRELIEKGEFYLNLSSEGNDLSKYHLEAAIAYWHTVEDDAEKWENILQLYNYLLQLNYSPIAALNRTYALAKARNVKQAIEEGKKLNLQGHVLYHSLMGDLFRMDAESKSANREWKLALSYAKNEEEKRLILRKIEKLPN